MCTHCIVCNGGTGLRPTSAKLGRHNYTNKMCSESSHSAIAPALFPTGYL